MGFEQLAELKRQLQARRLEEERQSSNARPGPKGANAKRGDQGNRSRRRDDPNAQAKKGQGRPGPSQRPTQSPREDDRDPVLQTIGMLQRRFPKAFPKKPDPKLPLKLGIYDDLLVQREKLNVDESLLKNAIETWCKGSRYWSCLVADAPRVDLLGEQAGTVTAHEAKYATVLARRRQQQARKAASKPAAPRPEASSDSAAEHAAPRPEASGDPAAEHADATASQPTTADSGLTASAAPAHESPGQSPTTISEAVSPAPNAAPEDGRADAGAAQDAAPGSSDPTDKA